MKKAPASASKAMGSRKPKHQRKNPATTVTPLRAAYDLVAAKKECLKRSLPGKRAVAWYEDGRLKHGFGTPPPGRRAVQCLVCSTTTGWEIWEMERVSHALLNDETVKFGEGLTIFPVAHSLLDWEENECVWFGSREPAQQLKDLLHFASVMEARLDDMERQAEELLCRKGCQLPAIVREEMDYLMQTGKRHFKALRLGLAPQSAEELDVCTAFVQGARIERVLSRLDAILANSSFLGMAARQGASGQRLSRFWDWVVRSSPVGTAKEIFFGLDGSPDPANPRFKMRIEDLYLIRFEGTKISLTSFSQKLSKLRTSRVRQSKS